MIAKRAARRVDWNDGLVDEIVEWGEDSLVNTTQLLQLYRRTPPEYQDSPYKKSGYIEHKVYSWSDSKESYQNKAGRERTLLWWNNRTATKVIVLSLLTELSIDDIRHRRTKIFRYLNEHGIEAYVIVEITRARPKTGKPTRRVNFHILTDDLRSKKELRALFNEACERSSLNNGRGNRLVKNKDFRIIYKEDIKGFGFDYYLKYGEKHKNEAVLFEKHKGLQKIYRIGKWNKDENNTKKKIENMRKEIKACMKMKEAKIATFRKDTIKTTLHVYVDDNGCHRKIFIYEGIEKRPRKCTGLKSGLRRVYEVSPERLTKTSSSETDDDTTAKNAVWDNDDSWDDDEWETEPKSKTKKLVFSLFNGQPNN